MFTTNTLFNKTKVPSHDDMRRALELVGKQNSPTSEASKSKSPTCEKRPVPVLKTELTADPADKGGLLGGLSILPSSTIARLNNVADNSNAFLGEAMIVPGELQQTMAHLNQLLQTIDTKLIANSDTVTRSLTDTLTKLETALSSLTNEGYSARVAVKQVANKALATMESIEDSAGTYVGLFLIVSAALYTYHHPSATNVAVVTALGFAVGFTNSKHLGNIMDRILRSFTSGNALRPQALGLPAIDNLSAGLAALFVAALGASGSCKDITKAIKDFMPIKFAMATFVPKIIELFQKLINLFRHYVLGLPDIELLSSGDPDFDKIIEESRVIESAIANSSHESTTERYAEIEVLRTKLRSYLAKFGDKNSVINAQMKALTGKLIEKFSARMAQMETRNLDGRNTRQQPVAVCFMGGPSKFKTAVLDSVITAVVAKTFNKHDQDRYLRDQSLFTYNYDTKATYYDTYQPTMQFIKIDEFAAVDGDTPSQDPFVKLVDLVNTSPLTFNAAHVDKKDILRCNAKLILMTTNRKEATGTKLVDIEAFQRRVFEFVPVPKPEYAQPLSAFKDDPIWDSKVDDKKCGAEGILACDAMLFYEVTRGPNYAFGPYGKVWTFDEVVDLCVTRMEQQRLNLERNSDAIKSVFDRYTPSPPGLKPQSFFANLREPTKSKWPEYDALLKEILITKSLAFDELVELSNKHYFLNLTPARVHGHILNVCMMKEGVKDMIGYQKFVDDALNYLHESVGANISDKLKNTVYVAQTMVDTFFNRYPILKVVLASLGIIGVAAGVYYAFFRKKHEDETAAVDAKFMFESVESSKARKLVSWAIGEEDTLNMRRMDKIYSSLFKPTTEALCIGTSADFVKSAQDYFDKLQARSEANGVYITCFGAGTRYATFLERYVAKGTAIKYMAWNAASLDWICKDPKSDLDVPGDEGFIGIHPRVQLDGAQDIIKYAKLVTASAIVIASGVWLYHVFVKVSDSDENEAYILPMVGMETQNYTKHADKKISRRSLPKPLKLTPAIPQNLTQIENKWLGLCSKNLFSMRVVIPQLREHEQKDVPFHIGFILMIGGRIGILPQHYHHQFRNFIGYDWDCEVHLYDCNEKEYTSFNVEDADVKFSTINSDDDIMAVKLAHGNSFRTISNLFPTEPMKTPTFPGTLLKFGKGMIMANHQDEMHVLSEARGYEDPDEGRIFVARIPILHRVPTMMGDCGAVLVSGLPEPRIVGIHVAGCDNDKYGIAYGLTKQIIDALAEKLDDPTYTKNNEVNIDAFLNPQGFEFKQKIPHLRRINQSSLTPSAMVNDLGPSTRALSHLRPAKNKEGTLIDPLHQALVKYAVENPCSFDEDVFQQTVQEVKEWFSPNAQERPVIVDTLTLEEAVTGGGRFPGLGPMPRTTSPGYPFCVLNPDIKKQVLGTGDFDPTRPSYVKYTGKIKMMQDALEAGVRISFPFRDVMKDEPRSRAKVDNVETRHVSGANFDMFWLTKVYFGAFVNSMVLNKINNGCCPGINPYSLHWTVIANMMQYFHDGAVDDGDYAGFDTSISNRMMWMVYDTIDHFYQLDYARRKARAALFWAIVNSEHVYDDQMVCWPSKLPSGVFLTTQIGCIVNTFNNFYARNRAIQDHKLWIVPKEHMKIFVFGDDCLRALSSTLKKYLTPKMFAAYVKELGFKYTSADKTKELTDDFPTFEELSFLKRSFKKVRRGGIHYDAPLELTTITDMVKWTTTNSAKVKEVMQARVENSLIELSLHGQEVFRQYGPNIVAAYKKYYGGSLPRTNWESNYGHVAGLVHSYGTIGYHNVLTESLEEEKLDTWLPSSRIKTPETVEEERLLSRMRRLIQAYPQSGAPALLAKLSGNRSNFEGTGVTSSYNSPAENTNQNSNQAEAPIVIEASVVESTRELGSVHQMSLTSFVDTAEVVKTTVRSPNYLPGSLLNSASSGHKLTLDDYFARPVLIISGTLNTNDGPNTFGTLDIASLICTRQPWADKHKGALSIRCTVRIKLVVNATPFQQGLYLLYYLPTFGGDGSGANVLAWINGHKATKNQVSQLARAELDLNCDSSCELEIPYNSAYPMLPLCYDGATGLGNLGYFGLYPYQALSTVAASPFPSWNIYMSLHDVVLGSPAVPQSFRVGKKTAKGTPSTSEQASVGVGPIATSFRVAATGLSELAKIPLLSSVATTPAWVADILAKSATSFGWSRPTNVAPTHRMQRNIMPYHSNVDAVDNSIKMSFSTKNEVGTMSNYAGSERDEMSIDFLKSIPAYIFTAPWTKSDISSTALFTRSMTPAGQYNLTTEFLTSIRHHTPISFLAENFEYYRGGLVVTMKIVKTRFHTGRLLLAFSPTEGNGAAIGLTWSDMHYVHKEIVDISETNEVTFEVPFVSSVPFRSTDASDLVRSSFGTLYVYVLDALQHPDTVPPTVNLIFEIAGARDLEFAVPKCTGMVPYLTATVQGPNIQANPCAAKSGMFSGMSHSDDDVTASEYCIGEKITSLRQIGKIYCQKPKFALSNLTGAVGILPFQVECLTPGVVLFRYPRFMPDFYSMMGCIYAASRGSTNHRVMRTAPPLTSVSMLGMFVPNSVAVQPQTDTAVAVNTVKLVNTLRTYADAVNETALSLCAAQYGTTHARANLDCLDGGIQGGSTVVPLLNRTNPRYWLYTNTGDSNVPRVYRCMADDADFGCFVSIPPVVYVTETNYPAD